MSRSPTDPERLLRRLEWTVVRRLDGLLQGDYRTLFRGFGLDLADLREYQYHDDVRHIDWNVTARLQTPYVREYVEDREITAWFLLDLSPSLDFGSHTTKRSLAIDFVTVMARLLTRQGNRVGALLWGDALDCVIPARSGRRHVLHLLHTLFKQPSRSRSEATDLGRMLSAMAGLMPRRSLVFLVSDFISLPGWGSPLARLARRHDLIAVRLFDPLEHTLPDLGMVVFEDAETGGQLLVDTHDPGFRRRYREQAQVREQRLLETLRDAGVDTLELATDDQLVDAILRFADLRNWRTRAASGNAPPAHLEDLRG